MQRKTSPLYWPMQNNTRENLELIGSNRIRLDRPFYRYDFSRRKELLEQLLENHSRRGKMLDFGCGCGAYHDFFASQGFSQVFGLDLSLERAKTAGKCGYNNVVVAHAQETPYPDKMFDVVVNQSVLVNVLQYEDRLAIVREAFRILKPGGSYLVNFPPLEGEKTIRLFNRLFLVGLAKKVKDKLVRNSQNKVDPSVYCTRWSKSEMESLLDNVGFRVEQKLGHLYLYPEALHLVPPVLSLLDKLLYKRLPYKGQETYILAVRP